MVCDHDKAINILFMSLSAFLNPHRKAERDLIVLI
jgi:hypothetical protein